MACGLMPPSGGGAALTTIYYRPFFADKAIDLVDEAASRLRLQIDSKPEELDELTVVIQQIEREALKKDDKASADRLSNWRAAGGLKQLSILTARWQSERSPDRCATAERTIGSGQD